MSINSRRNRKIYVFLSCRSLCNARTLFEKGRKATFRDRLWSFCAYVERGGLELGRVGDSSSITVVTANGEVQTTEEAQVYVHDLHIFVTVRLLKDTPPVLSLGNLRKEHGYTCEWPSVREPRLTKNGKQTSCRTENFVPLVVPGLSSSSTITFFLNIALRRIHLFLWIQQKCGGTKRQHRTAAEELRRTATEKGFPNGWRTSQRTSRSQKYLHPQMFLTTQIGNVL